MAYTTIDDPSAHFQTVLWTGDGNDNKQITNDGNSDLKPDLVWLKDRTQAESHALFDSSRGASVRLQSNNTNAESTESATQKSFTTDGFTVGTSGSVNNGSNPDQYVAWQWKANGGSTSTNSSGATNSTVQANTDAGFSIVTFTTTGSTTTFGHGLGVKPAVIISKYRSGSPWYVFTDILTGSMQYGVLNESNAFTNTSYDAPTSTVFQINDDASRNHVAYCFAEKQGYSKFGKYTGNGNADGPFVYTGFKPVFILFKKSSDSGDNWMMYDNKRPGFNVTDEALHPNSSAAEYDNANANLDILSNGFKLRSSFGWVNQSSHTYIFMAFAENPFTTSTGIPTTAR